ncbi:MAG: SBBP repeat-containing protein [Bryobacteraceae bacterium]
MRVSTIVRSLALLLSSGLAFAANTPSFPALTYSTYLRDGFTPSAIATDSSGNIYMTGSAIVDRATSQTSVLVVKLDPQASKYIYVRYLGGSTNDYGNAIAVDRAGNAFVAGRATSPDFPATNNGNPGTAPMINTERSFVAKLDPNGQLAFSDLLGSSSNSYAQAVAVNAAGQILVSGLSVSSGFPSTPGVYTVADTAFRPYLVELDPTGTKTVFSATGIGGNAIALDSSGNIYVAGTTNFFDYPTTPGSYQPVFPAFQFCLPPCTGSFQGRNQYVTKLDPTGSELIFSTAVSGAGNTANQGLAVDAAGNVYLTGLAGAGYPFTVAPPTLLALGADLTISAAPFLSKLDRAGQKLLFSVPVGGAGVQVDSNGSVYAGGILGVSRPLDFDVVAGLPALAGVPSQCLPNNTFIQLSAYASQVDATSGDVLGSQFIGGSTLAISGVALSGSRLWIAGATNLPDFPFSPNALTIQRGPSPSPGAYLGAVDFSLAEPPAGTPRIACVLDAADLAPAGPIVPYQLLAIFGTELGPAEAVAATDYSTATLGGAGVSFGSLSAPVLYVSSNQIDLAVPLVAEGPLATASMQVIVNGVSSASRQFPVAFANPSLFAATPSTNSATNFLVLALNADGSLNSSSNPSHPGSFISVFVNGLTPDPRIATFPLHLDTDRGWAVTNFSQANPFVIKVDLQVPSSPTYFNCPRNVSPCTAGFTLYDINYVAIPSVGPDAISGLAFRGQVYVTQF